VRDGWALDLMLLGATGFVGRLTAGYLAGHAPPGLRIGLAGRSEQRLAAVRDGLGAAARTWPLLAADSTDPGDARSLARMAGTIATTVGPYRRLGLPLARACAEAGTDYADLTGEVLFIRDTMATCQQAAARTGARIVHSCGFDSVPSDLGVLLAHDAAAADGAGDLEDTTLVVTAIRGGVSGGTLASALGQIGDVRASASNRRIVADPYALSPDRDAEPALGDERDLSSVRYDPGLQLWTGPLIMASFNTRIVRRSNALQGWAYGRRFRYREVTGFGTGPGAPVRAISVTAAFAALMAGVALRPSRALLMPLLPKPGEGPGRQADVEILRGGLIQLLAVSATWREGQVILYPDGQLFARIPAPKGRVAGYGLLAANPDRRAAAYILTTDSGDSSTVFVIRPGGAPVAVYRTAHGSSPCAPPPLAWHGSWLLYTPRGGRAVLIDTAGSHRIIRLPATVPGSNGHALRVRAIAWR
jgi:short subunit dehydrogenase-like uncharacterized protein